jgi:glycosyltransferase involved in cell wall biosynthesis
MFNQTMRKMKIAQVAPLIESVPPKTYGGTERIVSYLTEQLVELGHEVTLFASGDSLTRANLVAPTHIGLRGNKEVVDYFAHYIYMMELVQQKINDFDIIHYHTDYYHFPLCRRNKTAHCTTLHGRLDLKDVRVLFNEFRETPLVSISNSQRKPLPYSYFVRTVYHGLPLSLLRYDENHQGYLAFLGRISPEKGLDKAIEIAKRSGVKLKIAAKIDANDVEYYNNHIKKLLDHPLIEYVGEIGDDEKNRFLGGAMATLFPINWPEPFGLVMIESMACGTPVIAFNKGSVPEVIDHGETGYIVNNVEEATAIIKQLGSFNRLRCRSRFEERFSDRRMALDYVEAYQILINQRQGIKKVVQI